jgi:hypothetical protein
VSAQLFLYEKYLLRQIFAGGMILRGSLL